MAIGGVWVERLEKDYVDYKIKQIKEKRYVRPELLGRYGIRF